MRTFAAVLAALYLSACATVGLGGGESRTSLWRQAHDAFSRDSFRVAEALFQRLATEHPRTHEGHEARFYLGVLSLEPRSRVDLNAAAQHLGTYIAEDTLRGLRGYHVREAESLLTLARLLATPCARRSPPILCEPPADTLVVARPAPDQPDPPAAGTVSAAEAARLRRLIAERDATIQQLRDELQRIRNTLAPRNPRE